MSEVRQRVHDTIRKRYFSSKKYYFVIYKNMPVLQLALNVPFIFIGMFIKTLFFVRKGFGEDYCKGILEGICDCRKCWKVKFRIKIFLTILKYNWNCGAI